MLPLLQVKCFFFKHDNPIFIAISKFSLRSGIACRKTLLAEIRIWWVGFHQLQLYVCAAVGAIAQINAPVDPFRTAVSPVLGTNYSKFEWFVPKARLRF